MPGVFISYRRQDSSGHTGRLFDRLKENLGADRIFMDVTGIDAGVDFVHTLEQAVGSCDVLLAVIGPAWLSMTDAQGRRRLDAPDDLVRLELSSGLKRNVPVIPVLIAGAAMPTADVLPDDLKPLVRRQALEIRDGRWSSDAAELVNAVAKQLHVPAIDAARRPRVRWAAIAGAALVVAALAASIPYALSLNRSRGEPPALRGEPPASIGGRGEGARAQALSLQYAVVARPDPKRHPQSAPVRLAGDQAVSAGDAVRLSFNTTQDGYLYVVNESPSVASRASSFNILFPSPTSNDGSPRLLSGRTLFIPERGDGFLVDAEEGSERLWLVWSTTGVNELDAVAHWANERDQGEIKNAQDAAMVRAFLTQHASPAPTVEESGDERTTLRGGGQVFVKLVTLEHRR
jgi:hypothetical protein